MQWHQQKRLPFAIAAALLAASSFCAWAQSGRTIRLILPFPPGGPAGAMARLVAQQIGVAGGPTMVIESHPGAATEIGTELVSRAAPDGNTLAIISNSFVVLPYFRKLNYDPFKDFAPICELANFPPLIVVNGSSPYRTLADLIAAARTQPGSLTLGTIGPATSTQLVFEMLKLAAKVDITFVPFNGYTPAIQALLGDHITAAIADLSSLQGDIRAGKLRALATTAGARIVSLPDVPTVAESGYKDVVAEFFGGIVAPAKTPNRTISELIGWSLTALKSPEIKLKYTALGFFPAETCGADYAAVLRHDYEDYGRIIRQAHLTMQ